MHTAYKMMSINWRMRMAALREEEQEVAKKKKENKEMVPVFRVPRRIWETDKTTLQNNEIPESGEFLVAAKLLENGVDFRCSVLPDRECLALAKWLLEVCEEK